MYYMGMSTHVLYLLCMYLHVKKTYVLLHMCAFHTGHYPGGLAYGHGYVYLSILAFIITTLSIPYNVRRLTLWDGGSTDQSAA